MAKGSKGGSSLGGLALGAVFVTAIMAYMVVNNPDKDSYLHDVMDVSVDTVTTQKEYDAVYQNPNSGEVYEVHKSDGTIITYDND